MQKNSKKPAVFSDKQGLVIAYHGNSVAVETADGQVIFCQLRRNQPLPVVGDDVICQVSREGEAGTVTQILPRRSLLVRGTGKGSTVKPMAANVDCLAIVMTHHGFSAALLDRYLIAAELLSIKPLIVINKTDLFSMEMHSSLSQVLHSYQAISYEVLWTSAQMGEGLSALKAYLRNQTAVLVGPSGVGKSSLIAKLTEMNITTGEVTAKGAGRHTTTATRLYHLPSGGRLIDSPGVRDFSLWPVTKAEIIKGFREFQPYIHSCKFRDCVHLAEPDCQVKAAVLAGKISHSRYESYQQLMQENQF